MSRLTKRNNKGYVGIKGYHGLLTSYCYECTEELEDGVYLLEDALSKLAEYEDLEEQGLLLKPPVKLGQKVFRAYGKEVCEGRIVKMEYNIFTLPRLWVRIEIWSNLYGKMAEYGQADKLLGIEFFLSREEAEQKLKEIEG